MLIAVVMKTGPVIDPAARASLASPLRLLVRISLLQVWRRLVSLRQQSRLLTSLIIVFIGGYWMLSFWMFRHGLKFLAAFPGLGGVLMERLLFLMFSFLMVLLLFSNVVICYTNFFRNRETLFLLSLPLRVETVCQWKLIESALLASWAFLFLVAPLLAAYGIVNRVSWHFYVATPVMIFLFILLPAMLGAWSAVALGRYLDRRSFQVVLLMLAIGLAAVSRFWVTPEDITDEMLETRVLAVLDRLLMKTQFSQNPVLPSYWLSAAVINWAEGALASAGFFLLVMLSHVLFFGHLSLFRLGVPFYEAASAVQSRGSVFGRWRQMRAWASPPPPTQIRLQKGWLEAVVGWIPHLSQDLRAILVKDIRLFWRDTTQWGQTLVLFGLLAVYIVNLRTFSHQLSNLFWIHLVSFLNLLACSLNLATLTTRFVFPQFSLEGKRLWIVGMAPLGLQTIVRVKFWLASCASLLITLSLTILSCQMLKMPWDRTLHFSGAITIMTLALNGLAVGLGVLYPNFKEDNPSKIVNGFGGTFCLVLSFLYILGSVVLLAVGAPWIHPPDQAIRWISFGWGGFSLISLLIGWLPMRLAKWRLRDFEL
jgi:ABC-2 type transport system permease protein